MSYICVNVDIDTWDVLDQVTDEDLLESMRARQIDISVINEYFDAILVEKGVFIELFNAYQQGTDTNNFKKLMRNLFWDKIGRIV